MFTKTNTAIIVSGATFGAYLVDASALATGAVIAGGFAIDAVIRRVIDHKTVNKTVEPETFPKIIHGMEWKDGKVVPASTGTPLTAQDVLNDMRAKSAAIAADEAKTVTPTEPAKRVRKPRAPKGGAN